MLTWQQKYEELMKAIAYQKTYAENILRECNSRDISNVNHCTSCIWLCDGLLEQGETIAKED